MAKKIGTHDGTFHCDEALACYVLQTLTKEFKDAQIIRSRDPKLLETLDCLVDVGHVYDPSRHRYDHHQKEFSQTLDEHHNIRLSSAGLIYKHFGKEVISTILGSDPTTTEIVFQNIYTNFIEALDGIDNGINVTQEAPKYRVTTDLSSRVRYLNPAWNESNVDIQIRFKKAMELAGNEFVEKINYCGKVWLPARQIVERAVKDRMNHNSNGEIIILNQYCPWIAHLLEIEEEMGIIGQIKYTLFPDERGQWRIQSVPFEEVGFENRAPLPAPWRGKQSVDLDALTGIEGCVFTHQNGFIGGNKTKEGAIQMALLSLKILHGQ